MVMPEHTHRAHFKQDHPFCDQVATLDAAKRGSGFADMNAVPCKDADVNLHWTDGPAKNHYRFIVGRFGRVRPMTEAELHRPVLAWAVKDVRRWRRTRSRFSARPATVRRRQWQARRRRVVICWELKSRAYANPPLARRFVGVVKASKWPAYYMTLMSMRDWGAKLKAFHDAGGETALLSHGHMRVADKPDYITRVWN